MAAGASVVENLLAIQMQMKLYHWQTKSYGRHIASDKFTLAFSPLIDRFVETYQGEFGIIKGGKSGLKMGISDLTDGQGPGFVKNIRKFLNGDLSKLAAKSPALLAIRDEMVELTNVTEYLFALK